MRKKMRSLPSEYCQRQLLAGYVMYVRNMAPAVPNVSAAESSNPTKPFVVKVHAQWCPVGL